MSLEELLNKDIFIENRSCMKNVSKDDTNDEFMTDIDRDFDDKIVIDFDNVKYNFVENIGVKSGCLKSVDSILYSEKLDKIIFIEFKNGKIEIPERSTSNSRRKREYRKIQIENAKLKLDTIRTKVKDSILICSEILNKSPEFFRENCNFILVYNESRNKCIMPDGLENNDFNHLASMISDFSQENFHQFNMGILEKICVNEVQTLNVQQFNSYYLDKCI